MDNIILSMPLKTEYLLPVRLFAGGLASVLKFDMNTLDDIKVATNEACLLLYNQGYRNVSIEFIRSESLAVKIKPIGAPENQESCDNELALQILGELVDDFHCEKNGDLILEINFKKS